MALVYIHAYMWRLLYIQFDTQQTEGVMGGCDGPVVTVMGCGLEGEGSVCGGDQL